MNKRKNEINPNYTLVDTLPAGAVSVREFCNRIGIDVNLFYTRIKRANERGLNIPYNVVVFNKINFVLP